MKTTRTVVPAALAALALVLGGCGTLGGDDPAPRAGDSRRTPTPEPTDEPTADEPVDAGSTAEPEPSGELAVVPAYFVSETPQGLRLFREFQRVDAASPLTEAAALVTGGKTLDPDYRSLVPAIGFASIEAGDDAIVATLDDDQWAARPDGMSKGQASLAVQQLVYTLQGVAQSRVPLQVVGTDGAVTTLLGVSTPVRHRPQLQVLGLVNVTEPAEGSRVSGTFTASGVASSFEATVPWEVRQDGVVVFDGFATAEGWMDKLYPWESVVDVSNLPPGTYEFVASTDDPSGGEGGGPTVDTKTFVIE